MSWKGFQKGVSRVPQTVKQKFSIGEITKDPVYEDAERRFQNLEKQTQKLHEESKKCFDSIHNILKHQIQFSEACAELYKPISGRPSDPDSVKQDGNPDGIAACERYQAIVQELQETVAPELDMIETRIIQPAKELMEIIKAVRKTTVKRNHKQLDYDRHRTALKKLEEKKDRSLKDDKAYYRVERELELATDEFNHYNDLLTQELPELFRLERELIKPLFESFYYMQLNIFYTLHQHMSQLDQVGYFDLATDIETGFAEKRGEVREQAEALGIVHFKTVGGFKKGTTLANRSSNNGSSSTAEESSDNPPPPYSEKNPPSAAMPVGNWSSIAKAKKKPAPPPPKKPKPAALSAPRKETVTALYDYSAQGDGDLDFRVGDVIEVVKRSQNENEWWTGKLRGKQGLFPGNYVSLDS